MSILQKNKDSCKIVTISLTKLLWKAFSLYCKKYNIKKSQAIAKLIEMELTSENIYTTKNK
jgi:hypothetical protein